MSNVQKRKAILEPIAKDDLTKISPSQIAKGVDQESADVAGQQELFRVECISCKRSFYVVGGFNYVGCPFCHSSMRILFPPV